MSQYSVRHARCRRGEAHCGRTSTDSGSAALLAASTVTAKAWLAVSPPGSVAIRLMVVVPGDTPLTVTSLPDTLAVATSGASEAGS